MPPGVSRQPKSRRQAPATPQQPAPPSYSRAKPDPRQNAAPAPLFPRHLLGSAPPAACTRRPPAFTECRHLPSPSPSCTAVASATGPLAGACTRLGGGRCPHVAPPRLGGRSQLAPRRRCTGRGHHGRQGAPTVRAGAQCPPSLCAAAARAAPAAWSCPSWAYPARGGPPAPGRWRLHGHAPSLAGARRMRRRATVGRTCPVACLRAARAAGRAQPPRSASSARRTSAAGRCGQPSIVPAQLAGPPPRPTCAAPQQLRPRCRGRPGSRPHVAPTQRPLAAQSHVCSAPIEQPPAVHTPAQRVGPVGVGGGALAARRRKFRTTAQRNARSRRPPSRFQRSVASRRMSLLTLAAPAGLSCPLVAAGRRASV